MERKHNKNSSQFTYLLSTSLFVLQEGVIRGYEPTSIGKRCNTEMNAAQPPSMLAMSPTPGWRFLREAEHRSVVHETSKGQGSPTGPRTLVIKL